MVTFPPHDPDYPDVDPATGDERETEPDQPRLQPYDRWWGGGDITVRERLARVL